MAHNDESDLTQEEMQYLKSTLHKASIHGLLPRIDDMPEGLVAKALLENDPKLANLLTSLRQRQIKEADEFLTRHDGETPDPLRHEHEYDTQARKFKEEMERYL